MAVTAQAQAALPLEPSAWGVGPATARSRRGWPWAAAGLAGSGILVAAIIAATLIVSGGAVSGDPTQARSSSGSSAGQDALARGYSSLVERYRTADRTWKAQADRSDAGSAAAAEALIRPSVQFADVVDQVDHDLVRLAWPVSMQVDVNALEAGLATVSGDLRSIGGQSVSSMPQWVSNVVAVAAQSSAESDRLTRHLDGAAETRS